ncbi:hypothetical protein G6F56_005126 [Rhizopus delemar]|nr:hypothetical protein G6F56_005126 [Rhizopus delemar]
MASLNDKCPFCNSTVRLFTMNFDCKTEMCENEKCAYPFTQSSAKGLIIEIPNAQKGYSNKKHKALSTAANTTGSSAASIACSKESVTNPGYGLNSTKSSDLKLKQKDQLHFKSTTIAHVTSNQTNMKKRLRSGEKKNTPASVTPSEPSLALPPKLALPPASTAKSHQQDPVDNVTSVPPNQPVDTSTSTPSNQPVDTIISAPSNQPVDMSVNTTKGDVTNPEDNLLFTEDPFAINHNLNFNIADIESFLLHDIESPSDTVIATPKAPTTQFFGVFFFKNIFK